jgi:putative FmdB family regulatory protein
MPTYLYDCACGNSFEQRAGIVDSILPCPRCEGAAHRRPFYRSQILRVERASVPAAEGEYQNEADKRALKGRGWDYDRALEHVRKNIREDAQGRKQLDVVRANANV